MNNFPRHDMDMDMGGDSSSGHGGMSMIFQSSTTTPLFSQAWSPTNDGQYAGTCIFLVILALVARTLVAFRSVQEARWLTRDRKRRYIVTNGQAPLAERLSTSSDAKQLVLSANGVEDKVFVVGKNDELIRPWRFSVDPLRAAMDTVIVGIGYLL